MLKPTKDEVQHALKAAEYMREHDMDKHNLAHSLLYFEERTRHLEKVLHAAELYVHFGQGSGDHAALVKAINKAKQLETHNTERRHHIA